jgi:hypothetical protein
MLLPWNEMPLHSRLWFYTANRVLTESELELLTSNAAKFCESWTAHGKDLHCSFQCLYQCVFILAVDEQVCAASGCSIDSSVKFLRESESLFNIQWFDRLLTVPVLDQDTKPFTIEQLIKAYEQGLIHEDSKIVHTTAAQMLQFKHSSVLPLHQWWAWKKLNK